MTNQAKDTVQKMLAAGFARGEFRVTTERKQRTDPETGMRYSEWGYARVFVAAGAQVVVDRMDAILAQGLGVQLFVRGGKPVVALVNAEYRLQGKVERVALDQLEAVEGTGK